MGGEKALSMAQKFKSTEKNFCPLVDWRSSSGFQGQLQRPGQFILLGVVYEPFKSIAMIDFFFFYFKN